MNSSIWSYYWFRRGFHPNSLQPEETLVSPVELAWMSSAVGPAWRLRFIDGFKFIFSTKHGKRLHRPAMICIIYINIAACKICQKPTYDVGCDHCSKIWIHGYQTFSRHRQNESWGLYHGNISLSADDKAYMRPIMGLYSVSQLCPCVLPLIMFLLLTYPTFF